MQRRAQINSIITPERKEAAITSANVVQQEVDRKIKTAKSKRNIFSHDPSKNKDIMHAVDFKRKSQPAASKEEAPQMQSDLSKNLSISEKAKQIMSDNLKAHRESSIAGMPKTQAIKILNEHQILT